MSVYLYDKALVDKLNKWTKSADLHIYGPDDTQRLFEVKAENDAPIQLPIIAVRRRGFDIVNVNRQPKSFDGFTLEATIEKSLQLNAIPIDLHYQIDIYTRYLREADEYLRNIIFNIVNFPQLTIQIPYNEANVEHDSTMHLETEVVDNSDVPERLVSGQFTRMSLRLHVDDAYLFDAKVRDNYILTTEVEVR